MKIYDLDKIDKQVLGTVGGKARGLAVLRANGLNIARGFVITEVGENDDLTEATEYLERFTSSPVAVRSSASNEDGEEYSSAGQYATFLNVSGKVMAKQAILDCIRSLNSRQSESYSEFFSAAKSGAMNVVVQEMVDAVCAGVCFTKNPNSGKSEIILEAVRGLGESLVSGETTAESFAVTYEKNAASDGGYDLQIICSSENPSILEIKQAEEICMGALFARDAFGSELDLEWAIDNSGKLFWLQARPITTGDSVDVTELDSVVLGDDHVYTTCNIGEMLPGAVTPLSLSTSVMAIEYGLRKMLILAGAYKNMDEIPAGATLPHFSGHLFFDLTLIYKMAFTILGAVKNDVERSICGKLLDSPNPPYKKKLLPVRLKNAVKYFKFLFSGKKAMKKLDEMVMGVSIPRGETPTEYYENICKMMPTLCEAAALHYNTSSHSGAMSSTLLTFILKDVPDEIEAKSLVAALLEDIDGIESVEILRDMRELARKVLSVEPLAADMTPSELLDFLNSQSEATSEASGQARLLYDNFISRHGHRAIKEAEMRSRSWHDDRLLLAENILAIIRSGNFDFARSQSAYVETKAKVLSLKKGMMKKGVEFMINQSRTGVYRREYTKSRFIRAVDMFKTAYKNLAQMLVEIKILPDFDLIYFLTHEEIGELVRGKTSLVKTALKRQRLFPEQESVTFKDVYIGRPEPISRDFSDADGSALTGNPISRGFVRGVARVVRSQADAKLLQKGEIMVAGFTDIGWSPYYSLIGGLITEVGSALSHGAVVAREFGLPLVAGVANATSIIKTGDMLELDATNGYIVTAPAG